MLSVTSVGEAEYVPNYLPFDAVRLWRSNWS